MVVDGCGFRSFHVLVTIRPFRPDACLRLKFLNRQDRTSLLN